jgi:hydrogenase small subunit
MRKEQTLGEVMAAKGVSRRGFMKFVAATTSLMALPPAMIPKVAKALENAKRPSVIWLPFQECTGCTESLTRSHAPSLEGLIFDTVSLDYQETIMAAAGHQAEEALAETMKANYGKYLLAIDGSIPTKDKAFSCIGGKSNYDVFVEAAKGAAAIVCVGTCSSFGGIPAALPNPTEPDRRQVGHGSAQGGRHREARHQRPGLPADPDRHHGRAGAVPDVRPAA